MLSLAGHIEVSLFLGPRGTWDVGAATRSLSGGSGPRARGRDQLGQCLEDCRRAADLGVRNVLVADEGVLWAAHQLREAGELPADMRFKVSVLTGPDEPGGAARVGGAGRGLDQRAERPERVADRRAARGQRRRARPLRRGARRRRRVRAALRHRRADPGRRAGLHQVRAAQRARDLPGRAAPARRRRPTPAASACAARGSRWTSSSAAAARRCRCHRSARPRCRSRSASREDHRDHHARARDAVAQPDLRAGAHRRGPHRRRRDAHARPHRRAARLPRRGGAPTTSSAPTRSTSSRSCSA